MSTTRTPMVTFLSLAPVASASYEQASTKIPAPEDSTFTRANSTSSENSDITTSDASAKQRRFLKLGHHAGDWSEEVIES